MNHWTRSAARLRAGAFSFALLTATLLPLHAFSFQLGLCEDYPEETRTIERARQDLLLLHTNHIGVLRIAFGWDAIEPERGRYDWSFWDDFVRIANELQISLIPYVCYTPEWAAKTNTDKTSTQPPANYEDFAQFMRTIVNRYKGQIHSWEIWNEADNPAYWSGSAEEYATLLKTGSRAVRDADANAKVVSGGLAWNIQFLKDVLDDPTAASAADVINLHNYYETWASDGVEQIDDYVHRAQQALAKAQVQAPIWLAEVGYSNFRTNRIVSEIYDATYDYEHTAEFQAASVFRMLTPLLSLSNVTLAAWYRITDLPQTEEIIGDVNNRHLGVLDQYRHPKPALAALQFFNSLFEEGAAPATLRVCKPLTSQAEVYAFRTAAAQLVVVAWLRVVTPNAPLGNEQLISDERRERIELIIPAEISGRAERYNETGKITTGIRGGDGTVVLELRGGEVAVMTIK